MNKLVKGLIVLFFTFSLTGCRQSIHEQLQENNWNVTSTSGHSYTAEFSETTIIFEQGFFQTGMTYSIYDHELIMINPQNEEEIKYEIVEEQNEIKFVPKDKKYGTLILSNINK